MRVQDISCPPPFSASDGTFCTQNLEASFSLLLLLPHTFPGEITYLISQSKASFYLHRIGEIQRPHSLLQFNAIVSKETNFRDNYSW